MIFKPAPPTALFYSYTYLKVFPICLFVYMFVCLLSQFIIEDMKQQQTNKHSNLHREDQHITVEELWKGWKSSEGERERQREQQTERQRERQVERERQTDRQ